MDQTRGQLFTGDLTNATIENASLNETTIKFANMKNAQFLHVDFTGSTVRASNLSEVNVEGNAWWGMRMNACDVFDMQFNAGILEGATVSNSHLVHLTIDNCVIDGLVINGVSIKELIENHPDYRLHAESVPSRTRYDESRNRLNE
ncbi:pentapeptide repeat-containing protein [Paenibacillus rhizovicinus]|uniref:Pentapeptide repeat-containing protein n=1 Tax=Paenibacillus rhizovicinus TaxID=2704463 RepID=A0A6C0P4Q9_9BACL|nr:pentapeptide repeat-containing protein [Paenibacillus rhizovicinus]QHW32813.1 pentapeptide repeat-containing protein [Paenibacillus rhizovicinus]